MDPSTAPKPTALITLDEGWDKIYYNGIVKLRKIVKQKNEGVAGQDIIQFSNAERMDLYTIIYNMCTQKRPHCFAQQLYERFNASISEYLRDVVLPAIEKHHGKFMLKEFVRRWNDHSIMRKWMCNFFQYLNRFYIKRHSKKPLEEVAVLCFRNIVFDNVQENLTEAILDLIKIDRSGKPINRQLLRDGINVYVEMGSVANVEVYVSKFETAFLHASKVFYSGEAQVWLENASCPGYLEHADRAIEAEKQRVRDYLHVATEDPLMNTLHEVLLLQHQQELLSKENTGARAMLETHSIQDFSRLYKLYSAIPALSMIADIIRDYIRERGMELLAKANETKDFSKYIEDLLQIHDKYYRLVQGPFKGNAVFHKCLKEAFETVVNAPMATSSTAELLAAYTNRLLVKGGVRLSDQDLQDTLDQVVRLFTYLTEKDLFSEFYRKHLSKRLLLQRSASSDAEQSMIGKLKLRCGAQFTSKFEGMINDMARGEEHHRAFKEFLREAKVDLGVEFRVEVLTTGSWPSHPAEDLHLAPDFSKLIDVFTTYYNAKTSNRRLKWLHGSSQVTLAGNFARKRVDLVISTIQATILLLFNSNDELKISDVQKLTGLPPADVKKYLRSLVSGKAKVLLKVPADGYDPSHTIKVNHAFTHQQRRVRIPHVPAKSNVQERKTSQSSVSENRKHAIEANIVRIMKSRKTLKHAQLISEVSQQLMMLFRPDPKLIKRRIEDLIAREYLERDKEDSSVYHYLA